MSEPSEKHRKSRSPAHLRAARLGAVQALYQIEIGGLKPEVVVMEFLQHRLEEDLDGITLSEIDRKLFEEIVKGVVADKEDLDDMLIAVLAENRSLARMQRLMHLILRAGVWELSERLNEPARAIISEYVDIAHGFFSEQELSLVNGLLEQIARHLRVEEFEGRDSAG